MEEAENEERETWILKENASGKSVINVNIILGKKPCKTILFSSTNMSYVQSFCLCYYGAPVLKRLQTVLPEWKRAARRGKVCQWPPVCQCHWPLTTFHKGKRRTQRTQQLGRWRGEQGERRTYANTAMRR